ncbi:MAG: exopolysaccharide biosynthesis protein [Elusimicrobiota bacterium]|nr:exopolysaccharide biosynthesis protein [Elusimicrobiota bacterium]
MPAAAHLHRLRVAIDGPLTLGELAGRLGEDGFPLLVVFLCLPFLQPVPLAGLSSAIGLYIVFAAVQHARRPGVPWVPGWVARRRVEERTLRALLGAAETVFGWVERLARPRLTPLARRHDLTGAVIAVMAFMLLLPLPIPFSNMFCALAMVLMAVAHLEEDGLLAVAGLAAAVGAAAYHAAIFAGAAALLTGQAQALGNSEIDRHLRAGTWNERVHAVHAAGERGAAGLEQLRYAADDADWQVRLTATHFLGRVGAPAAADLGRVLEHEPCRHVRLTALHWLGSLGRDGDAVLRAVLSGPWERGHLRGCASSPGSGRAPWAGGAAPAPAPVEGTLDEVVVTRDPTVLSTPTAAPAAPAEPAPEPRPRRQAEELDALLGPGFARTDPEGLPAGYAPVTGALAKDPVPALLALLKDGDPRKRARAADELGKRGPAVSREAVAPLAAALKDKDRRVVASAALALGNMGAAADGAVPALERLLGRGPEDLESSAALALGRIGTPLAKKAFARRAAAPLPVR